MDTEKALAEFLAAGHRMLDALDLRWREGANRRTLIILVTLGVVLVGGYLGVVRPPADFPIEELVSVPEGESLGQVSRDLEADGVVRSALMLRALVTLYGAERTVHPGDYLFDRPLDVFTIARAIAVGRYGLEPLRIRVPEGATVREMASIFGTRLTRFNAANFVAEAQDSEGYLFPDTYFMLPNATEDIVFQTLRQNFDAHVADLKPPVASTTHSLSDIVILASIVEREAYNSTDRRLIAGVLWNRLDRGMALQVDAPFAYSIGKGTFDLTVGDLKSDSPYNTYVHKGLPPTPIGSPSMDSLEAVLNPTETEYLFFLADKQGVTHFCKTYACQQANKDKYF